MLNIESPCSIESTISWPDITFPNTVWRPSNQGVSLWVIKNWLPFVPGPALAIDNIPAESCFKLSTISSLNEYPGDPDPVPVGSPPWIIKSSITLWKVNPS